MAQDELRDVDGFCRKIESMVQLQRDTPTFFDQARTPLPHSATATQPPVRPPARPPCEQRVPAVGPPCDPRCAQVGPCVSLICDAACDHHVKLQPGFVSIALSVKVVEGVVIQVDPCAVVAPRAKGVIVREHMKRAGRNMLGRSLSSGGSPAGSHTAE